LDCKKHSLSSKIEPEFGRALILFLSFTNKLSAVDLQALNVSVYCGQTVKSRSAEHGFYPFAA
jgi:hypothetical protein